MEVAEIERDSMGDSGIDIMRRAADLDVPLDVNFAWGDSWGSAKS